MGTNVEKFWRDYHNLIVFKNNYKNNYNKYTAYCVPSIVLKWLKLISMFNAFKYPMRKVILLYQLIGEKTKGETGWVICPYS